MKGVTKGNIKKYALNEFLTEYKELNTDNKYRPVAVGRYGIRKRESIYSKELAKDYSKNKLIHKDTLTVGMGSKQIDIGILIEDETFAVSPAYHTYEIQGIRCKYLEYCLQSKNIEMFSLYAKRGSRQGKSIDLKRWLTYKIPVYSEKDQIVIEENLNKINYVIELRRKQIDLLDELVKARFVEMFGDPNYNPKGYKKDIIKDHIDLLSGYPFKSENYVDSGINICGGLVIMPQKIKWEECVHWKSAIGYENYLLNNNDIVMALDRPWISEGFKIAKVDSKHLPALLIQRTVRIRSIDMNQDYLYYCFICGGFNKHCNVTGSLVPHISSKDIKSFEVMLPPLELQNQFASFVQEIDKSRLLSNHSLFLIKSLIF